MVEVLKFVNKRVFEENKDIVLSHAIFACLFQNISSLLSKADLKQMRQNKV